MMTRLRSMISLGWAADRLGTAVRGRKIRQQDADRLARHGDDGPTIKQAQAYAASLDSRATTISDA